MPPKKIADPGWTYPHATRLQIENLRIYFSHFATRVEGWGKGIKTHALPQKETRGIPWASVPPQHRAKVEEWFNRKIAELKARGVTPSAGKIRSLRMNASNYGRYVLTGHRRGNRSQYEMKKKKWLRYLEWKAAEDRKELLRARGPEERKVLEIR